MDSDYSLSVNPEFHGSFQKLIRVNQQLNNCNMSRYTNNIELWRAALESLYQELAQYMDESQKVLQFKRLCEIRQEIERIKAAYLENETVNITEEFWVKIMTIELFLREVYQINGLDMKFTETEDNEDI